MQKTFSHSELASYLSDTGYAVAVFTHNNEQFPAAGWWIRKFASIRYNIPTIDCWSHCGLIFYDSGESKLMYAHQTFPYYKIEPWEGRYRAIGCLLESTGQANEAISRCRTYHKQEQRYGVVQLVFKAIPMITGGRVGTPVTAGRDCAESLAMSLRSLDSKPEWFYQNVDPNMLEQACLNTNMPRIEITS